MFKLDTEQALLDAFRPRDRNLSCQRKLEDEASRSGRSVKPALDALIERMGRFATEALQIDLSGAGR